MMMGTDNAARVMHQMDEQEQYELAVRMAKLSQIPGELQTTLSRQCARLWKTKEWIVGPFKAWIARLKCLTTREEPYRTSSRQAGQMKRTLRDSASSHGGLYRPQGARFPWSSSTVAEVDRGDLLLALKGPTTP